MNFNNIGYFQFNNLLQSRVPLVLVVLDEIDLKPWYNSLIHMHLENVSIFCDSTRAVGLVNEKKLPPHFAIIILDMHGQNSPKVTEDLEKAGYLNVYYVKNGFVGISEERQNSKNV